MRESLRSHLTFANIVACVALFVALGGTAYAAATIGSSQVIDNSLQSRDLRDGAAVRSQDVVNDNVTGGGLAGLDVRNNTLTSSDVGPRAVGQSELAPAEAFRTDGFLWPAYHSTWSSPGYYRDPFGRPSL